MNEDDVPARVVWLAPAVIRRTSNTCPDPKQEFRVCLFERKTLEPIHVRHRTGQPALWGMRYDQLRELAQPAEQGGAAIIPRASSLARVFLRSSLWHDAVLAWDAEAQEEFDKSMISRKHPHLFFFFPLTNIARYHRMGLYVQSTMQDLRWIRPYHTRVLIQTLKSEQ
jgi:hypothetical protein